MSSTQLYRRDATGITFSSPLAPEFSVRFKTSKKSKTLDGLKTENVATEIIVNDKNTISKDNATSDDLVSVRVRISGSVLSHDRLKTVVAGVAAQLSVWAEENVILGFEPTTPPNKY